MRLSGGPVACALFQVRAGGIVGRILSAPATNLLKMRVRNSSAFAHVKQAAIIAAIKYQKAQNRQISDASL